MSAEVDFSRQERKLLLAGLQKLNQRLWNPTSEMCCKFREQISKVEDILCFLGDGDHDVLNRTVIVSPTYDLNGHDIGDILEKGLGDSPYHSDCEAGQAFVYINSFSEERVWEILREHNLDQYTTIRIGNPKDTLYPEIYNWPSAARFWDKAVEKWQHV
jgi:hypothetical protein